MLLNIFVQFFFYFEPQTNQIKGCYLREKVFY